MILTAKENWTTPKERRKVCLEYSSSQRAPPVLLYWMIKINKKLQQPNPFIITNSEEFSTMKVYAIPPGKDNEQVR